MDFKLKKKEIKEWKILTWKISIESRKKKKEKNIEEEEEVCYINM